MLRLMRMLVPIMLLLGASLPAHSSGNCYFTSGAAMCYDQNPRAYALFWQWDESCECTMYWNIEYRCCEGDDWITIVSDWESPYPESALFVWRPAPSLCSSRGFEFRVTALPQSPCGPCVSVDKTDCQRQFPCTICPPPE